jgi:hypothetical protein
MSGGEPLWRRVAGLYLSGVPLGGREDGSSRANPMSSDEGESEAAVKQHVVQLGEALDLVTLAQGYGSPAVPLLLRALVRRVRQLGAASGEAKVVVETPAAVTESNAPPTAAADTAAKEPAVEPGDAAPAEDAVRPGPETGAEPATASEPEPDRYAALEQQFKDSDRKIAALTTALGQLVAVLQRRTRDGGGIDRRGFPRVPGGNAKIYVRGNAYEVVNWSRSGFLIRIAETDRFSRGAFDFHFVLDLPDETIQFQGRALPARIERTLLAAEFAALDGATGKRMAEIAARLAAAPV